MIYFYFVFMTLLPSYLLTPSVSATPIKGSKEGGFRYNANCSNFRWLEKASFSLKFVLNTWRNGGSVLQNWQYLTASNCKLSEFPAYLEVESGLQLYFQLPRLEITVLWDHEKGWKWKKTWVRLSLCVQVHRDQSLLHFKMAECESVLLQPSSCSTVCWQPLLCCIYTAGLALLRSACLQWIVPTYNTLVHIKELVWIRTPVSWNQMRCVPATCRHKVHTRLKSIWTKLPEFM